MSNIIVRLQPKQGIRWGLSTTYLFDPNICMEYVNLAKDWAIKLDGKIDEEGEEIDYSAKAYAIGGVGTETNNAKYYSLQASLSSQASAESATQSQGYADNASQSATAAEESATEAESSASEASGYATNAATSASTAESSAQTATEQAGIATDKATLAEGYATTATTQANIATTQAGNAASSATTAETQAGLATTKAMEAAGSANDSKQWAIGEPKEPESGSAKSWALKAIKTAIVLTGESGTLTAEQIALITDNQRNYLLINDGEVFYLYNTASTADYKTFLNLDVTEDNLIEHKAIYIQLNPEAVNYGEWNKEDIVAPAVSVSFADISGQPSDNTNLNAALLLKANTTDLNDVAFSGSYNDLSDTPAIPSKTSDLTNDSGFINKDVNDLTNYTTTTALNEALALKQGLATYDSEHERLVL